MITFPKRRRYRLSAGFLNYGEEIPTIWQKMLQENIFVEREVDLAAILEAGSGREGAFMRGGRYPCKLGEKIIDIDPYDGQYMVVSELAGADGARFAQLRRQQ